jgi:nicotinate-nucleotide adenylyltransferase
MRLGIFGGTFDPVHYGHLLLAECCRERCRLDQVWFVPANIPPHKQQDIITPGRQRAEMLELALGGHGAMAVSRIELDRPGASFTVDTLQQIADEDPNRQLTLLLGADSLLDLPHWKDPRRICELATLAIAGRPDVCPLDLEPLKQALGPDAERLRIEFVDLPQIDLSSRDIRRSVAAGASIRYRTPRAVEKYIETAGLYRAAT